MIKDEKLTEVHGGTDKIYYFKISDKMKTQWGLIRKKNK
jgi:hypothetical protein